MSAKTKHTNQVIEVGTIRQISDDRAFTVPAYRPARYEMGERWSDDRTDDVPAAHGGIAYTEEESLHGRQRLVVENGGRREVGPWGPTRETRQRQEVAQRAAVTRREHREEDRLAREEGVRVTWARRGSVEVRRADGTAQIVPLSAIELAASNPWHPHLTAEAAARTETEEERRTRLIYRALLRQAQKILD